MDLYVIYVSMISHVSGIIPYPFPIPGCFKQSGPEGESPWTAWGPQMWRSHDSLLEKKKLRLVEFLWGYKWHYGENPVFDGFRRIVDPGSWKGALKSNFGTPGWHRDGCQLCQRRIPKTIFKQTEDWSLSPAFPGVQGSHGWLSF